MKPVQALTIAAGQGSLKAMEAILDADPALAKSWQPIMEACFYGHGDAVRLLLRHGADPNILSKSSYRYRPLHRTVEHKVTVKRGPQHLDVVHALLDGGADPMLRGRWDSVTPLAVAVFGGETQFIPLLRSRMLAELDIFNAALLCESARVDAILDSSPDQAVATDESGYQALGYAVRSGIALTDPAALVSLRHIVECLVHMGADPQPAIGPALGLLRDAVVLEALMAAGGQVTDGDTIVHAAEKGRNPALDVLHTHGADLNCTTGTEHHGGYTPLGCLVSTRRLEGVRWMLSVGVDPNLPSGERRDTALHIAARYGAGPSLLALLLDHGADPTATNADGLTPAALAISCGKEQVAKYLQTH